MTRPERVLCMYCAEYTTNDDGICDFCADEHPDAA